MDSVRKGKGKGESGNSTKKKNKKNKQKKNQGFVRASAPGCYVANRCAIQLMIGVWWWGFG